MNEPKDVKPGCWARQGDTDFPLGKEDGEREGRTLGAQLWWQWLSLHHAIAMFSLLIKQVLEGSLDVAQPRDRENRRLPQGQLC